MTEHETPVLVVGGSLVGMFAAALLARHGIGPLVVERHPGAAIHPRAAMIYQRTMEIIRSLGIEDPVREESYRRFEPDGAIMSVESIAGAELNWDTAIVRALGCFLSMVVVGLGFLWIVFDEDRQAWHDKIAGTLVVRTTRPESLV